MNKKQPTVPTSEIMSQISDKYKDIPKKILKDIVSSFLSSIENHVGECKKIRLDKLGVLTVKEAAARQGRNPQTGETIQISARKKISFQVAKNLKKKVSNKN